MRNMRPLSLSFTFFLVLAQGALAGRRGLASPVKAVGRWGTPASYFDFSLPVEEDLAKDLAHGEEVQEVESPPVTKKTKQVKAVRKPRLVQSAMPGPMPGPSLFGFPPIIGLEQE